jgi:hypothetical protein
MVGQNASVLGKCEHEVGVLHIDRRPVHLHS